MRLIYHLMVHQNPPQLARLLHAISHPDNHYLIHVDKKAGRRVYREFVAAVGSAPDITFMPRRSVIWAGFSMVAVELDAIKHALTALGDWDFIINLSGQDFPLKSQTEMRQTLASQSDSNFIHVKAYLDREYCLNRIRFWTVETPRGLWRTRTQRRQPSWFVPYGGASWFILSRGFCEYLVSSSQARRLRRFYRFTAHPDEAFFQTVLMNSRFRDTLDLDYKRFILWDGAGAHPETLTLADLPAMVSSEAFFARKFDPNVDSEVIKRLEQRLRCRDGC